MLALAPRVEFISADGSRLISTESIQEPAFHWHTQHLPGVGAVDSAHHNLANCHISQLLRVLRLLPQVRGNAITLALNSVVFSYFLPPIIQDEIQTTDSIRFM